MNRKILTLLGSALVAASVVQVGAAAAAQGVTNRLSSREAINSVIPWNQTATRSDAALPACGFAAETESQNVQACDPRNVYVGH
jgi:hypothetical protein